MKVDEKGYSFFAGNAERIDRSGKVREETGKVKNGSLFAGDLNLPEDKIAKRKQEAREQAAKVVSDAFAGERKIDEDVAERHQKIADSKEEMQSAQKGLQEIEGWKEELKASYGITADSQEQKDLELLEKRRDFKKPESDITITEDEWKRLEEIDKQGITEYQQRSLEYDKTGEPYRDTIKKAKAVIAEESDAISTIRNERLKSAPILEAAKSAEEILKSASKEAIGMLMEEAKELSDEKREEEQEVVEEREKEKEEFEERLEDIKEKNEQLKPDEVKENEAGPSGNDGAGRSSQSGDKQTEQMLSLSSMQEEIKKELEKIMDELQVTQEDLMGIEVDTKL